MNFGQAAVGLIVLLVVVGGLLYLYYSRANAVEKNGYGAVIMLSIVSLMIPAFWIIESNNQASATVKQFNDSILRGMVDYAQNCTYNCYGIIGEGDQAKIVNPKYNGFTFDDLNQMLDPAVTRIISAGEFPEGFKAGTPDMPSDNAIPRSLQYGGALSSNDVADMLNFIRSHSAQYRNKHGYPHDQLEDLSKYLAGNASTQYDRAVTYAKNGQFGEARDLTNEKDVTIDIVDPGKEDTSCPSQEGCFAQLNIKVKVGTTITWKNVSSMQHTVTATDGQDLLHPKPVSKIFDSASKYPNGLIPTGQDFSYVVSTDAYNFNSTTHEIVYYCSIHPTMLAKLTIVPA
jgi:plastocyanin